MCFMHAVYSSSGVNTSRNLMDMMALDVKVLCSFVMATTEKFASPNIVD